MVTAAHLYEMKVSDTSQSHKRTLVVRALQVYWRTTRALTMGSQGLVIAPDRRVLLVRHTYRSGWHFPGGGVEKGETIHSALARELREEAGVTFSDAPELFGVYANFHAFPCDHIAFFVVRDWEQKESFRPSAEIAECRRFAIDDLPNDTVEPVRRRLTEVLEGVQRSEFW